MIEMLRVDDRLIHGQIALYWSKHLRVDSIIVANDAAAGDKMQIASLKFACPADIKLAIVTIEQANKLIPEPRLAERRVLLIVNNFDDARALILANKDQIKIFCVGNYGKNVHDGVERKLYSLGLSAHEGEIGILEEIIATGVESILQTTPDTPGQALATVIRK